MSDLPEWVTLPQRVSPRHPQHDYSMPGAYFVTFCTHHRIPLLGKLVEEQISLTGIGQMVSRVLRESDGRYPGVELDCFGLMPDHIHMIIWLRDVEPRTPLPTYMNRIKTLIATRYRAFRSDYPKLPHPLLQGGYYDRFIRDDEELYIFRKYIMDNPLALKLKREGHIP
jgi:putative transposase